MGYNLSGKSLFNQNSSATNIFVTQNNSIFFKPSAAVTWTTVYGQSIAPLLLTTSSGTVSFAYGQKIFGSISSSSTISNVYGMKVDATITAGTVSSAYNLYVTSPTQTSGSITNICSAFFGLPTVGTNQGGVGIGTTTPTNALDVNGGMSLGSFAGSQTISYGVVAVSGPVSTTPYMGVGTPHPTFYTDIQGVMQAGAAYGWMPTGIQQKGTLSQGWNGLGGGTVGNSKQVSTVSISIYNPQLFGPLGINYGNNWGAGGFDGRYVYYYPGALNGTTFASHFIRYDTTLPYNVSTSYSYYNLLSVNANCYNFDGACFDGRYIYMTTYFSFFLVYNSLLVRYDTWAPFNQTASYAVMDTTLINTLITGLISPLFTGDYVYFTSNFSNILVRYSINLPFTSTTSYQIFRVSSVASGMSNGVSLCYDGRNIYISGFGNQTSNFIVYYDTTKSFSSVSSYTAFSLLLISGLTASQFWGMCFDGRFIYLSPLTNYFQFFSGQVVRYDTTLPFTSTGSWAFIELQGFNGYNNTGWRGIFFDGRYVYVIPSDNGLVTGVGVIAQYDTLLPFSITIGFSFLSFPLVNSNLLSFQGAVYDGNYVYLPPNPYQWIIRIDAYRGYPLSSLFASNQASNGFTLGTGLTNPIVSPTVSAGTIQIPSLPAGYMILQAGTNVVRKIPYYN